MNPTVLRIKTMQRKKKNTVFTMLASLLLTSCGSLSNEVENKLNELKNKTESLDSLVNKEIDKVLTLDSLINQESDKVKKLDTLINKTSSQLDSISVKGSWLWRKTTN
jgi:copper homeostasis protein CutC